ncbi:hypothetical protein [Marinomonas ostreistagni]|uniref:hypothetical protein n=1 Tax=Marinomonas ostreistagni TaxID=359209 RepID=UPI00195231A5|nr:hypothetical protein [Marinomonas ostreistagni]MBM6550337.1 hypothetical protein [Marinomonas ostreistagni]
MYTSEDVNVSALYNLHYTGSPKKTLDSQEQYEATLAKWGYATKPSASRKKLTNVAKKIVKTIKASFSLVNASALLAKRHSVSSHIV